MAYDDIRKETTQCLLMDPALIGRCWNEMAAQQSIYLHDCVSFGLKLKLQQVNTTIASALGRMPACNRISPRFPK